MKHLMIALLTLCYLVSYSQIVQTPEQIEKQKLKYRNDCISKYKKDIRTGIGLQVTGVAIFGISRINQINGMSEADEQLSVISLREAAVSQELGRPYIDTDRRTKYYQAVKRADKFKKTGLIIGGIFAAAGLGFEIHSISWLGKAYIGENGIGLNIPLN